MSARETNHLLHAFSELRKAVSEIYPDVRGIVVTVELPEGRRAVLPLPPPCPCPPAPQGFLSEFERTVLGAFEGLEPGAKLGPEQVAERSGYPLNSRLRDCLASLVRRGLLVNERPGYRLP